MSSAVLADGAKAELFTATCIGELYDVPIRIVEAGGWYQAVPGSS